MSEDAQVQQSANRRTRLSIPAATLKRVMQTDEDVGRIAQTTPAAMCRAVELFVEELTKDAVAKMPPNASTLTLDHMSAAIRGNEKFDFLTDMPSLASVASDAAAESAAAGGGADDGAEADTRKKARIT